MDFGSMFQSWQNVLTKPREAVFEEERRKPNANLTTALIWIVVAAVISAVFNAVAAVIDGFIGREIGSLQSFLAQLDLPPELAQLATFTSDGAAVGPVGTFFITVVVAPIGLLIISGIFFLVAKLFGGTGNFEAQTYLLATFIAPLEIINSVVSVVPILGDCIGFLISIYELVLSYFAIKVAHNLTSGKAVGVVLTPVVLFILCVVCLFAVIFITTLGATANQ